MPQASESKTMDTVQLLFHTRTAKNDEELLDKVQSYLAALLHNGQIMGDHTPMAKVGAGLLVTASLPEADALADRFANKWVRKPDLPLGTGGHIKRAACGLKRQAGAAGNPGSGSWPVGITPRGPVGMYRNNRIHRL